MVSKLEKKPAPLTQPKEKLAPRTPEKKTETTPPRRTFASGGDALSTGRGGALRRNAVKLLGAEGLSISANTTVKASDLLSARHAVGSRAASIVADAREVDGVGSLPPAVADAARNVEKAWAGSADPKQRDASVLAAIQAGAEKFAKDPALAAHYVSAIGPTVTRFATDLGARKDDKGIKSLLKDLGKVAEQLGPEATLALGASIARGLPDTKDLIYVDDALKGSSLVAGVLVGLVDQGKLSSAKNLLGSSSGELKGLSLQSLAGLKSFPTALAGPLSVALGKLGEPVLAAAFSSVALGPVDAAIKTASDANAKVDALQNDLNLELQHVPEEDRNAFQQRFWAEHRDALDEATSATAALKTRLEAARPTLTALAASNPATAEFFANGLAVLAHDPAQADFVTSTIEGLKVNGQFPKTFEKAEEALVGAFAAAKQSKANVLLASGDTAGAKAVLEETLSFLETTKFLTKGIAELREPLENFVEVLSTGDLDTIKAYLTQPENPDLAAIGKGNSPLGTLITGLAVAVSVLDAFEAKGDLAGTLKAIFEASGPGAELIAQGLDVLAGAVKRSALEGKLTSASEFAASFSKGLGKIAGVVGVVVGVIDSIGSVRDVFDDATIQSVGSAVSSVITTVGGALALFPPTAAIGGALAVVGGLTGVLTNYLQGEAEEADRDEETKRLLLEVFSDPSHPASKLSKKEREALAEHLSTSEVNLEVLRDETGLSYEQLLDLGAHTNALSFESPEGWSLGDVAKALDLDAKGLIAFLKKHHGDFIAQVGIGWEPTRAIAFDTEATSVSIRNKHPGWSDQQVHEELQKQREAWRFKHFSDWVNDVARTTAHS